MKTSVDFGGEVYSQMRSRHKGRVEDLAKQWHASLVGRYCDSFCFLLFGTKEAIRAEEALLHQAVPAAPFSVLSPATLARCQKLQVPLENIDFEATARAGQRSGRTEMVAADGPGIPVAKKDPKVTADRHFGRPRRADPLRPGFLYQPGQHGETPSLRKIHKSARVLGSNITLKLVPGMVAHAYNHSILGGQDACTLRKRAKAVFVDEQRGARIQLSLFVTRERIKLLTLKRELAMQLCMRAAGASS
ncbi:hypothetical protein AAY473_022449 [Plecturocebus cupreus]